MIDAAIGIALLLGSFGLGFGIATIAHKGHDSRNW